jgi:hypothetical protein
MITQTRVTAPSLQYPSSPPLLSSALLSQANNLSIPWADIQHSLARLVPKHMIHCSYDYAGNEEDEDGVTVYFRGRLDTVRCKVLVGIDGLFSGVRKSVAPFPDNGGDEVGAPFKNRFEFKIRCPGSSGLPSPLSPPLFLSSFLHIGG